MTRHKFFASLNQTDGCTHPVLPDDDRVMVNGVALTRKCVANFCIFCGKYKDLEAMGLAPDGSRPHQ